MYICSTEEVVTDKGRGHRLPPWQVFSWTPFCPLTPTRHPLPEACSAPRVPVCCPAPCPRLHVQHQLALRPGAHGPPSLVTVMTGSALALLPVQTSDPVPGSCSGPSKPASTRAEEQGAASSLPRLFWVFSGQSPVQPQPCALPVCVWCGGSSPFWISPLSSVTG